MEPCRRTEDVMFNKSRKCGKKLGKMNYFHFSLYEKLCSEKLNHSLKDDSWFFRFSSAILHVYHSSHKDSAPGVHFLSSFTVSFFSLL